MKQPWFVFLLTVFMLASCAGQRNKIIIRPDPAQNQPETTDSPESWQITESKNGANTADIPDWVRCYFNGDIRTIESPDQFNGKYLFIGENRGDNFNALQQWSNGFSAAQDLPRLVAARVERRLTVSASLYPDDEYGQYFENVIKKIADEEYQGAVKEQTFWVRRRMIPPDNAGNDEPPQTAAERYEFLVLISINSEILRKQIGATMSGIRTTAPPTREQAARISKMQQTFFEGF